jgi:dTDP-4-amino-4,6-dideoxygalactose transaminase
VLSFGRGKPVSLLGGGAVLTKQESLHQYLPRPQVKPSTFRDRLTFGLKARVYNVIISPLLYWLLESLPFLHLGETRYHPLLGIDAMDQLRLDMLASNVVRYQNDIAALSRCEKISTMLDLAFKSEPKSGSMSKLINLPTINDMAVKTRLLRYPLLVDESSRARIVEMLKKAGLGVSIMYPVSLPKIAGLEQLLDDKTFRNAEKFAARIVTLPTHAYVNDRVIAKMKAVIDN